MQIRDQFLLFLAATVFFGAVSLPAYGWFAGDAAERFQEGDGMIAAVSAFPGKPRRAAVGEVLSVGAGNVERCPSKIEHPPRSSFRTIIH